MDTAWRDLPDALEAMKSSATITTAYMLEGRPLKNTQSKNNKTPVMRYGGSPLTIGRRDKFYIRLLKTNIILKSLPFENTMI